MLSLVCSMDSGQNLPTFFFNYVRRLFPRIAVSFVCVQVIV